MKTKLTVVLMMLWATLSFGTTLYVDVEAAGNNNGSSWANAYNALQDALGASQGGDEIWVAAGTYTPDKGVGYTSQDYTASFILKSGVGIYGGFAGNEALRGERDYINNATILSGDFLGNDANDFSGYDENSFNVVKGEGADETATLDGFTITGGNANDTTPGANVGAGLLIFGGGGSPTIANCNFIGNTSSVGGSAIYLVNSGSQIVNCTFENNYGGIFGAIYVAGNSPNGKISDCSFIENSAPNSGGGIRIKDTVYTIENCSFDDNTISNPDTTAGGGAIAITSGGKVTITGSTFTGNIGKRGGAIYAELGTAEITVVDCQFSRNSATFGGAVRASQLLKAEFNGCTFSNNGTVDGYTSSIAGAIYNYRCVEFSVKNCQFYDNESDLVGALLADQATVISNSIFAGNTSGSDGGATRIYYDTQIYNSVFYNNTATAGSAISVWTTNTNNYLYNSIVWNDNISDTNGSFEVYNSDIEGGWSGTGANNINSAPLFVDATTNDFHLTELSPCIDTGDNSVLPEFLTKDLDGRRRIFEDTVDMGPYEYGAPFAYCGDEEHPYPIGDYTQDCIVNFDDLAIIAANWLVCTSPECID